MLYRSHQIVHKFTPTLLATILIFGWLPEINADTTFKVGQFETKNLDGWEPIEFNDTTTYEFVKDEKSYVLQASSDKSASGLVFERDIDLKKFPYLNWRWRIDKPLPKQNEQTKSGDDYAARVYVIVSDGWFFWQTKALNYVWSSSDEHEKSWANAYAPDNTQMLSLRTRKDSFGVWYVEKRNVYQDLRRYLGKEYFQIKAVAIMTDSDDSGLKSSAMYGDIYFSND